MELILCKFVNCFCFVFFSVGGLILDYTVANYHGIAVFQPVINGKRPKYDYKCTYHETWTYCEKFNVFNIQQCLNLQ